LNREFREHWRPERFAHLVDGNSPLTVRASCGIHDLPSCKPTIAVAYDEAFFGYFPSTLDQLELLGAQVVDFSPLRDESLPLGTDIVYLGCGRPEAFAGALSENHCMKSALRSHVACGGRIYGEVGGAAYLSQMIEMPSGESQRMCGILPAVARFGSDRAPAKPIEITVAQGNWLAPRGTRLRGYRSERWHFETLGCRLDASQKSCCQSNLIGCNCVVGSLIHFHFAALPEMFQSFFRPSAQSVPRSDPWQTAS
jgi:cobyrinic acid a,c-diamide synthase